MATTTNTLRPHEETLQLLTRLQMLLPSLPEPHKGAVSYAFMVLNNPSSDTMICDKIGKVVQITARLSQKTDHEITLRGENGPLYWDSDISTDNATPLSNPNQKTFLLHIPPDQMNETLFFKFVAIGKTANEAIKWQRGENCVVDLSQHGHIAIIEIPGVTFSDL